MGLCNIGCLLSLGGRLGFWLATLFKLKLKVYTPVRNKLMSTPVHLIQHGATFAFSPSASCLVKLEQLPQGCRLQPCFVSLYCYYYLLLRLSPVIAWINSPSPFSWSADTMASPAPLPEANTAFSQALLKKLSDEDNGANVFFSPFSISSALAMVMLGARGNTAAQMSEVMQHWTGARTFGPVPGDSLCPLHLH